MGRSIRRALLGGLILGGLLAGACMERQQPAPALPSVSSTVRAIIGGKPDLSHPAVGALTSAQTTFCTGTLIASRVVLTAGHCIDSARGRPQLQFRIDVPNPQAPDGYDKKYYDAETNLLSTHPNWNQNASAGSDVGFLILKQQVPAGVAKPIPANNTPLTDQWRGKEPLFLGYGYIQSVPNAVTPNRKYGATIPIINVMSDRIEHRASGRSVCHGDSGGPALFTISGQLRVIAVNSYVTAPRVQGGNPPRSSCNASGVSMRTDTYRQYVNAILTKYGDGPAACTSDTDCGGCGTCGAKKVCEPKSFPLDSTSCKPCRDAGDCNGGRCHRFNSGFRCLQECTTDGCCPDGTVCTPLVSGSKVWHCVPKIGSCAAIACSDDKACGPGETCQSGVCAPSLPPRAPKLCHPCRSVHDCDSPNHLCTGPQGNQQCLMPCGAGDFCPKGFSCAQLYSGAPKQCVPESGSCHVPCQLDAHCPQGFACDQQVCARKGGGQQGDPCDPMPCKDPLQCVATASGKRCLQSCGVPKGNAGSFCNDQNACDDGSRCFSFGASFQVCLRSCNSSSDCANSGGGQCYRGICVCQRDSDCGADGICNFSTGSLGACVKSGLRKPCPDDTSFECRTMSGGPVCVPKGAGSKGLGEKCDSLNRCRPGLVCLSTQSGPTCFEDCTKTRKCALGGRCLDLSRGGTLAVCLCQGGDCPTGRICQPVMSQYGFCKDAGSAPKSSCLADHECPPNHECKEGSCATLPPPKEEPPAPRQEPATPDASPGPEPRAKPEPPTPDAAPSVDAGPIALDAPPATPGPDLKPPGGSCGCQTSLASTPAPSWAWWILLILPAFRRQRP